MICVPLSGKHIPLVICVPLPGKHESLVICVPPPGKHIFLVICVPLWCGPTRETQSPSEMFPPACETHMSPTQETHIASGIIYMCFLGRGTETLGIVPRLAKYFPLAMY